MAAASSGTTTEPNGWGDVPTASGEADAASSATGPNGTGYVFHMEGHASAPERVVLTLEDAGAARAQAVIALGWMLRARGGGFWERPEWRVEITDEAGARVGALTIQGTRDAP